MSTTSIVLTIFIFAFANCNPTLDLLSEGIKESGDQFSNVFSNGVNAAANTLGNAFANILFGNQPSKVIVKETILFPQQSATGSGVSDIPIGGATQVLDEVTKYTETLVDVGVPAVRQIANTAEQVFGTGVNVGSQVIGEGVVEGNNHFDQEAATADENGDEAALIVLEEPHEHLNVLGNYGPTVTETVQVTSQQIVENNPSNEGTIIYGFFPENMQYQGGAFYPNNMAYPSYMQYTGNIKQQFGNTPYSDNIPDPGNVAVGQATILTSAVADGEPESTVQGIETVNGVELAVAQPSGTVAEAVEKALGNQGALDSADSTVIEENKVQVTEKVIQGINPNKGITVVEENKVQVTKEPLSELFTANFINTGSAFHPGNGKYPGIALYIGSLQKASNGPYRGNIKHPDNVPYVGNVHVPYPGIEVVGGADQITQATGAAAEHGVGIIEGTVGNLGASGNGDSTMIEKHKVQVTKEPLSGVFPGNVLHSDSMSLPVNMLYKGNFQKPSNFPYPDYQLYTGDVPYPGKEVVGETEQIAQIVDVEGYPGTLDNSVTTVIEENKVQITKLGSNPAGEGTKVVKGNAVYETKKPFSGFAPGNSQYRGSVLYPDNILYPHNDNFRKSSNAPFPGKLPPFLGDLKHAGNVHYPDNMLYPGYEVVREADQIAPVGDVLDHLGDLGNPVSTVLEEIKVQEIEPGSDPADVGTIVVKENEIIETKKPLSGFLHGNVRYQGTVLYPDNRSHPVNVPYSDKIPRPGYMKGVGNGDKIPSKVAAEFVENLGVLDNGGSTMIEENKVQITKQEIPGNNPGAIGTEVTEENKVHVTEESLSGFFPGNLPYPGSVYYPGDVLYPGYVANPDHVSLSANVPYPGLYSQNICRYQVALGYIQPKCFQFPAGYQYPGGYQYSGSNTYFGNIQYPTGALDFSTNRNPSVISFSSYPIFEVNRGKPVVADKQISVSSEILPIVAGKKVIIGQEMLEPEASALLNTGGISYTASQGAKFSNPVVVLPIKGILLGH